ncbi:MAG: TrkH family potassium uptake protein [Planctomycetota bacterium]
MNYSYVVSRLGLLLVVLSVIMLAMAGAFFVIVVPRRMTIDIDAAWALFVTGDAGLIIGGLLWVTLRRGSRHIGRREALLLVAMSWIVGALFSALPYWLWANFHFESGNDHVLKSLVSAYFEAMSGLTTTGATVLQDIESLPRSLLLWRALTHWLGGLGIVVLFVAVLPGLGVGGKRLFQVEAPGPAPEGLQPHIRETARWLWYIYLGLTVAEVMLLWGLTPMGLFDSVCHTFATLATGGFSTRNASVGAFHAAPAVDMIVIVFMILAGANFGLYYQLIRGRGRSVLRDPELRLYLILLFVGSVIVTASIYGSTREIALTTGEQAAATIGESIRQGVFTTVAIQTTTGFCTSDFNLWPFLAQAMLVTLMFIGGSSGSTGGGIKVIRLWIAFKVLVSELEHVFRPQVIRPVRLGGRTIEPELKLGTIAYVFGIVILFGIGSITVMLLEQWFNPAADCTYTTAATASVATLCTIGPGLGQIGAIENYGWMSDPSKCVLSLLMALGRLEVFAIIVLFSPRFWRGD